MLISFTGRFAMTSLELWLAGIPILIPIGYRLMFGVYKATGISLVVLLAALICNQLLFSVADGSNTSLVIGGEWAVALGAVTVAWRMEQTTSTERSADRKGHS